MKPVAIFRHARSEGPGYFATWLEVRGIPHRLHALDAGEPVPVDARAYSGLCFMGGPMSVNDDLPWIAPALVLIRDAVAAGVPVIGHCLGGQLMSKALGGEVRPNPVKEIGWGEVTVEPNGVARAWLGGGRLSVFQWHGETFSLPPGAVRIAANAHCTNQAFVLEDRHLGLQCHVEMTGDLVRSWVGGGADEIREAAASPAVQRPEDITADLETRIARLHALADRVYARWAGGLAG